MTAEEKNTILQLRKEGKNIREIAAITNKAVGTVDMLLNRIKAEKITGFSECPHCGKEIIHTRRTRGRPRVYCSKECQRADETRRNTVYICQECGRSFRYYQFQKSKFCSRSCYMKHRYGERLQNKNP